jgi:hypothetical protein
MLAARLPRQQRAAVAGSAAWSLACRVRCAIALDVDRVKTGELNADEATAMIPVVTHQARVALEVGKIVAKGQGMSIP